MTCYFCGLAIPPDELHYHHLVPRADGGDPDGAQVACHRDCHNRHHRENGDYTRWRQMDYAEKVRVFGQDEVHRILATYGRKGYAKAAGADPRAFHSAGGRARAANGRDARGRFVPVATARPIEDPDRLLEAF